MSERKAKYKRRLQAYKNEKERQARAWNNYFNTELSYKLRATNEPFIIRKHCHVE